ncbi:hypothetical protein SSP531S_55040 [Streptomyces spongiicola]|uniref:Uncharacterized protein n=1 Tax=Streptomyces spongiicola TaxID=1690221 RepID=A0A388T6Z3_9ACTN|nr:hypothetical protein SSP531S_55040 [Streptomyces spongiicola]
MSRDAFSCGADDARELLHFVVAAVAGPTASAVPGRGLRAGLATVTADTADTAGTAATAGAAGTGHRAQQARRAPWRTFLNPRLLVQAWRPPGPRAGRAR